MHIDDKTFYELTFDTNYTLFQFFLHPINQQVALIAINVLGEYLSTENAMQLIQNMNNERTDTALASICDDLSFSMYVEESIVVTIRELEQKKIKAVNGNGLFVLLLLLLIWINAEFLISIFIYRRTI